MFLSLKNFSTLGLNMYVVVTFSPYITSLNKKKIELQLIKSLFQNAGKFKIY